MPSLAALAEYLNETLEVHAVPDYPGAMNGVQLANFGDIVRVATAVDFSSETVNGAIDAGARLLMVHHGMFWGGAQPITGHRHQRLWSLITHDVAVYSVHLPLDLHRELGNNVLLAKRLGLEPTGGFGRFHSIEIGVSGESEITTDALVNRARVFSAEFGGTCVATRFAEGRITRKWGLCTGAGADSSTLREAAQRGLDTLLVGEGPHHTAVEARDLGIVVIYAGHYATETLGIRALGEHVAEKFGMTSIFLEAPSGL